MDFFEFVLSVFVIIITFMIVPQCNKLLGNAINSLIVHTHILDIMLTIERTVENIARSWKITESGGVVWVTLNTSNRKYSIPLLVDSAGDRRVTLVSNNTSNKFIFPKGVKFPYTPGELGYESITISEIL